MKIAWYTHRYHPCIGGAETYGREMVRRFVRDGHGVDVLTTDAKDLWYFNDRRRARLVSPEVETVDGARVRRFRVRHIPLQKYVGKALSLVPHWPTQCRFATYMPLLPGMARHRGDYDLVAAVGFPFTNFSYEAWRTARRAGCPLVLTPFLHLSTPGDAVAKHYTRPHQARLLRQADLVVVMTRLEREAVLGWGVADHRILINPMGHDRDDVTGGNGQRLRERLGIDAGRLVVGHLATLDPNKGTNDLVTAVAHLNQTRPAHAQIVLVLAGISSPHFEKFAAELPPGTDRWMIRTGPLPASDKADFFDMLDIFAMPSRTDSFGIVFLEAWANARPVVGARAGGVVEVIDDGRDGLMVDFGDTEALAHSLGRLADDPALRHQLGRAGRQKVDAGYSWDDCYQRLCDRIPRDTPNPSQFVPYAQRSREKGTGSASPRAVPVPFSRRSD